RGAGSGRGGHARAVRAPVFFFHAEDGIRGKLVTGVQTCALPIFAGWKVPAPISISQGCVILQPYDMEMGAGTFHPATVLRALGRSEERRVGKERTSQWVGARHTQRNWRWPARALTIETSPLHVTA